MRFTMGRLRRVMLSFWSHDFVGFVGLSKLAYDGYVWDLCLIMCTIRCVIQGCWREPTPVYDGYDPPCYDELVEL